MKLSTWVVFAAMAAVWGALSRVGEHYAGLTLSSYRAQQAEEFYVRQLRHFLQ